MSEFQNNEEYRDVSSDKQDCERKAFYRFAERIKKRFPKLKIYTTDSCINNSPDLHIKPLSMTQSSIEALCIQFLLTSRNLECEYRIVPSLICYSMSFSWWILC